MSAAGRETGPLQFVHGDDDYRIAQVCRNILDLWRKDSPDFELEIVEGRPGDWPGSVETFLPALRTPALFSPGKILWWRDCPLASGASEPSPVRAIEQMDAERFRLLISARELDKRKRVFKDLSRLADVTPCPSLESLGKKGRHEAIGFVIETARNSEKVMDRAVAERLVEWTGRDRRTLASECEKAILHAGGEERIAQRDVEATVWPSRQLQAFAFVDAVADRDLPRALDKLEDELFGIGIDSRRSEIGLLYTLTTKFRMILMVKDLLEQGLLRDTGNSASVKPQLEALDDSHLAVDRRFNPKQHNPYVVFSAMQQSRRYGRKELVRILGVLLKTNGDMLTFSVDPASQLRKCVMDIIRGSGA